MTESQPLRKRESYKEDHDHPLTKELQQIRAKHNLAGAVLINFAGDEVGVTSTGMTPEFAKAMSRLADQILTAIDDGQFDPEGS